MRTFAEMRFLVEAATKNLHMEHLEDEVLNGGVNGTRGSIMFLRSLRDMLSGHATSSTNVTVKWDGSPAIVAGIDPASKEFFVSYKSMKKLNFSQADVEDNFDGPLATIYSQLMRYLPNLKISGNAYQGDVLWTQESQKVQQTIDGEDYITFTPNTITYAVPMESDLAKKILRAKVGIVFHTTYNTSSADHVDDLSASFGADISAFTVSDDVWVIDSTFTDVSGSATFTKRDTKKLNLMMSEIGKLFNQIDGRFLDNIALDDKLKIYIKAFLNNKIRSGEYIGNPKTDTKDFLIYINNRLNVEVGKLKSVAGRERKQLMADQIIKNLKGNTKQLGNVFKLMALINNAKLFILQKLEEVRGLTNAFIRTDTGFKVTRPEGFVAIDRFNKNKGLKLVNRLEFSQANFNIEKNWDQ